MSEKLISGGDRDPHYANNNRPGAYDRFADGSAASDADLPQAIGTLRHHLNVQQNLCGALEAIADGLPFEVSSDDCLALARSVYPIVHRSHVFEEEVLFPLMKGAFENDSELKATLDRLHGEHWEDESYAEEVHHELMAFAADRSPGNVEKLSYMLRGFFTGLQRHIAFEREHILPMLERAARA